MKSQLKLAGLTALLFCVTAGSVVLAQRGQRDPLGFLKHAITEAGAPALTSNEETQINTLITNFRNAQPTTPDATLTAARTAFENAILAGDLATANAQATIIANRTAALSAARLQAEAKFDIDVLTILKNGGQYIPLTNKFGTDRVLGIVGSLVGGPPFGERHGGPGSAGEGPAFGPGRGPGRSGGEN